jgi:hypothetical protein
MQSLRFKKLSRAIQNYMLEHPAHSIFTYNLSSEYKLKNERVRMN